MARTRLSISRRVALAGGAATAALTLVAPYVRAQPAAIKLGTLTPLTGAGGNYGPSMLKAMQAVAERVNGVGGVLGRRIELVSEDDQTNPDAAVRAARKLIDVDKVAAIMGTWASSVTTAVAPLCWESKVFLTTVSGSDTITQLPHQGYLVRTQPNTHLQIGTLGQFLIAERFKKVFVMSAQTPFAVPSQERLKEVLPTGGSALIGSVIYDKDKTTFRSEVDQALRTNPDMIYINGYTPDVTIIMRELYRAGYNGGRIAQGYALNEKLVASLPPEVTEGALAISPSPAVESPAYKRLQALLSTQIVDPYSCQTNDHASLVCLTIQKCGEATGVALRDNVRKISQGTGQKTDEVVEALKLLQGGKDVNYEGASGPCDFTPTGDITTTPFRYEKVEKGQLKLLRIG